MKKKINSVNDLTETDCEKTSKWKRNEYYIRNYICEKESVVQEKLMKSNKFRWITNGHFTKKDNKSLDIIQWYSKKKFEELMTTIGYDEIEKLDYIFALTEGEYIIENFPEDGYEN